MDRLLPLAGSFLVAVCVFAWLAGPVLETRFGAEALLTMYAAVAVGAGAVTYAVFRRVDARLSGQTGSDGVDATETSHESATDGTAPSVTTSDAESTTDDNASTPGSGGSADDGTAAGRSGGRADDGQPAADGASSTSDTTADTGASGRRVGSLDELESLAIDAEVERLKRAHGSPSDAARRDQSE
ncbi:hypothetical protein [Halorubrum vacuolatum]|uniref:Uncharacterized protein n=1 Tax=Halorubrum vacuolatum TaxID=63740 RepID=A0A238XP68_HALVU|nr:hypothetical protein [Halorubrum vacuolatum]SNR60243.1 hypothetical protein SAMN06264855_12026 [Halorubrum vacuolatum]